MEVDKTTRLLLCVGEGLTSYVGPMFGDQEFSYICSPSNKSSCVLYFFLVGHQNFKYYCSICI